jgi:NADPH:quinone reductase-like Zn-dependent oxidoreductase
MKTIVYRNYGSPDVLKCEEIEKPTAGDDEVLIEVRAASVNPLDWHFMRGTPYFVRILAGLRKLKDKRLGVDVAGQVEAVGRNVTQFKPGDEVFGACRGAFAEYACTSESALAMKPDNVTFDHGACVVTVREPEPGHGSGETEQRGPDHPARAHEGRKGNAGHRQALQIE